MVLFGYDNAFTAPLVSLPLFVAKYQGPGYEGTYAFTVSYASNLLRLRRKLTELGEGLRPLALRTSNRGDGGSVCRRPSSKMAWAPEDNASSLYVLLCAWISFTAFCT